MDDPASFETPGFLQRLINSGIPANSQTLALLEQFIRAGRLRGRCHDFYNQVQWNDDLTPYLEGLDFDAAAFAAALDEVVVQPIIKAQEILDSMPYMTRIFTTISPEEMDRDPVFVNAPNLGDVSNIHTAEGTGICESSPDGDLITNIQLTLPNGTVIDVEGEWSPWDVQPEDEALSVDGGSLGEQDSASSIALIQEDGTLREIEFDMVDYEDQQIELAETGMPAEGSPVDSTTPLNPENPAEIGTDTGTEGGNEPPSLETPPPSAESSGCQQGFERAPLLPVLLGLLFLAATGRSRRVRGVLSEAVRKKD